MIGFACMTGHSRHGLDKFSPGPGRLWTVGCGLLQLFTGGLALPFSLALPPPPLEFRALSYRAPLVRLNRDGQREGLPCSARHR